MYSGYASASYGCTGGFQTYTVPSSVTVIQVDDYGARGGTGGCGYPSATGGWGGYMSASIAVTPGQVLYIYVGCSGSDYSSGSPNGGYNGGGNGEWCGLGGGGATDIRTDSNELATRLVVAGGGGGSGSYSSGAFGTGGNGGGMIGGTGGGYGGGLGGSQTSGGCSSGSYGICGSVGSGGSANQSHSGGGGGGHFGGGSGNQETGAGGGSSHTVGTALVNSQGVQLSDGFLFISIPPGNKYDGSCMHDS